MEWDLFRLAGVWVLRRGPAWCLAAAALVLFAAWARGAGPPGPRGPVGPDVPLGEGEARRLARRVVVEGRDAAAVQAACARARREGRPVVFLPRGKYVFAATVTVPEGLTVLGEGSGTWVRVAGRSIGLFRAGGDGVRFSRLRLEGADPTPSTENDTRGIVVSGGRNVRIDHCDLSGFSYAVTFCDEAAGQVDHCLIHHNLRDGLGYGVAVYSGAWVLVCDNRFWQNRHSLASNGALDWSSPKRLGRYVHKPGVRKTHWTFVHNWVGSNDRSPYELCAVDAHPGMDGTFVVEDNVFEGLRHGVGIRDGSGRIRRNVFRRLRTRTTFRPLIAVSIGAGKHNGIPVEGCMPHHIVVEANVFEMPEGVKFERCRVGTAEAVTVEGRVVRPPRAGRPGPAVPTLRPMGEDGLLRSGSGGPREPSR